MEKVRVTLVRSTIGALKVQKDTVAALGLRKIGQSKEFVVSDSLNGMINRVSHLIKVEKI